MDGLDLSSLGLPEKEQRILASAIRIFAEKGFSGATTSQIAKEAGVAEGTIFRYFKTKKDILTGILVHTINIFGAKLVMSPIEKILQESEGKEPKEILKQILYDRLKLVDSIFPMVSVLLSEALYHEDVREALYRNIVSKALVLFKGFHEKMVQQGKLRSDIKTETLLRTIMANIAILIVQRKLFEKEFPMESLEAELDNICDVILYGIAPNPPLPQDAEPHKKRKK